MDIALKQRLVGASVLIALAVVVLPMLLSGRPETGVQESRQIELPPQPPELDFETRRYPVGEPAAADQGDSAEPVANHLPAPGTPVRAEQPPPIAPTVDLASEKPESPQPEPAVEEHSEQPAAGAAQTEAGAADPLELPPQSHQGGRYIVQVASFGAMDNAQRLSETLKGYGYQVMLDTVTSDVSTLHRVRVGPYATETAANETVARLETQIGDIKPRIMDLQPGKTAQVTEPSDPLVRWIVQVGSFSSTSNADKLVARLRQESLSAYKEKVQSSGSVIYRVRVGPFLEREEAIRIDNQIKERLGLDGVVMSAN